MEMMAQLNCEANEVTMAIVDMRDHVRIEKARAATYEARKQKRKALQDHKKRERAQHLLVRVLLMPLDLTITKK